MQTLELRWFAPEAVGDRELVAFAEDRSIEARTDSYLLGTGDTLGVKRRGAAGLLEHKRRLAQTQVSVACRPQPLPGVAERWFKSWPERGDPGAGARWAAIAKRRALQSVGGCRAELTRLRAPELDDAYMSLAIETTDVDALDSLLRAAATLLDSHAWLASAFAGAESCGYPAWIEPGGDRTHNLRVKNPPLCR